MLYDDNPILNAATITLFAVSAINVLASIMTLGLIRYMYVNKALRLNLYSKIVITMTIFQCFYDITFFLNYSCSAGPCVMFYYEGFGITGVVTALWSMLIVSAVLTTIITGAPPSAMFIPISWVLVFAISATIGLLMYRDLVNDNIGHALYVYDYSRLAIIVLSVIQMIVLVFHVIRRSRVKLSNDPLYLLTQRLIWYPVVQIISRLGGSSYDLAYSQSPADYQVGAGAMETTLLFAFAIFTPSAGMGFFIVFLYMQNGASLCLKRMCIWWKDHGDIPAYLLRDVKGGSGRHSELYTGAIKNHSFDIHTSVASPLNASLITANTHDQVQSLGMSMGWTATNPSGGSSLRSTEGRSDLRTSSLSELNAYEQGVEEGQPRRLAPAPTLWSVHSKSAASSVASLTTVEEAERARLSLMDEEDLTKEYLIDAALSRSTSTRQSNSSSL